MNTTPPSTTQAQPLCLYFHIPFLRILYQLKQIQALSEVTSLEPQDTSPCDKHIAQEHLVTVESVANLLHSCYRWLKITAP